MKAFTLVLVGMMASSSAMADGFRCEGKTFGTMIQVYNQTQAARGTRNAAVMVVSDKNVAHGRKTIATFAAGKNLVNEGATYYANVDSRMSGARRGGEYIAGTRISELRTIRLDVDFNYYWNTPSVSGSSFAGTATYYKENGKRIEEKMRCTRYVKR